MICKEPYQNDGWKLGSTIHRPVALPCGHVFGLQCIARWILSANYDNRCPLCRVWIINGRRIEEPHDHLLEAALINLDILFRDETDELISPAQKNRLLDAYEVYLRGHGARVAGVKFDQVMVVLEEFLSTICTEEDIRQPLEDIDQLVAHVRRAADVRADGEPKLFLSQRAVQTLHWIFLAVAAYIFTGILWRLAIRPEDPLFNLVLWGYFCFLALLASVLVQECGIEPSFKTIIWAVVAGVLLASIQWHFVEKM